MGVVVRETHSEMRMAKDSTTANSWNKRPSTPPMSKIGMNTAIKDKLMDTTVKPISRLPLSAASLGVAPLSRCRVMFSSTTMASSTTKPVAMVKAIKDKLLRL